MSAPTVDRFELRHGRGATRHWAGLDASAVGARELADELSGRTLFALSSAPILALHGAVLERFAAECRAFHRIEIPDGEAGKSLEVAGAVWRRLLELGGKRDSLLIAFGGGSVGDHLDRDRLRRGDGGRARARRHRPATVFGRGHAVNVTDAVHVFIFRRILASRATRAIIVR